MVLKILQVIENHDINPGYGITKVQI